MISEPNPNRRDPMALRRYELLSELTHDIVLFLRPDGHILEANRAAVNAYGYTRAELLSLRIHDLRSDLTRGDTDAQFADAQAGDTTFETVHRRKDGSTFPVEVSSSLSPIGGVVLSLVRDISRRKRAEATQALVREIDLRILGRHPLAETLQMVCAKLSALYGYALVWIALKQPDGSVGILSHAGQAEEFLSQVTIRWDETPAGMGPTGKAIRTGQVQLIPVSEEGWRPFREHAVRHGLKTALSLPLNARDETLGSLTFYAAKEDAFDRETVGELERFASQVAISLLLAAEHV